MISKAATKVSMKAFVTYSLLCDMEKSRLKQFQVQGNAGNAFKVCNHRV